MINTDQKQHGRRNALFSLITFSPPIKGSGCASRSWRRGRGGVLHAGLIPLFLSCLSYIVHLPAQRWHHLQGAGPSYINQQLRECLLDMTTGQPNGRSSSAGVLASQACWDGNQSYLWQVTGAFMVVWDQPQEPPRPTFHRKVVYPPPSIGCFVHQAYSSWEYPFPFTQWAFTQSP